jgi:hypothetical protein
MRLKEIVLVILSGVLVACSGSDDSVKDSAMPNGDDWLAIEESHGADAPDRIRQALSADPVYQNAGRFIRFTLQTTDRGLLLDGLLEVPIEDREFPAAGICTVPHSGPVIGARWLLDETTLSVLAVSPIWVDASCL